RLFPCRRICASRRDNRRESRSPPWPSTPRRCVERSKGKSWWPRLLGGDLVQQRLARPHVGERNRRVGDVEARGGLPRDREARTRQIARFRKIGAKVRAARILALPRRERNHPAHLGERAQVEPIMPGHIEGAALVRKACHQQ